MTNNSRRIVLAALRGGSGKTLVSMGLIAALTSRGLDIVPFKKGPDFIDAAWMSYAADRDCHHLDTFMIPQDEVSRCFASNSAGADGAVIEGNRGLFDGVDVQGSHSTAALAMQLDAPVILVLDCTKVTRTVAAMVLGCMKMEPELNIGGVVLNRIARSRHQDVIANSIREYCGLPTLGAIPKLKDLPMPERHLGLVPPQENNFSQRVVTGSKEMAEKYLDLDAIWQIAGSVSPIEFSFESKQIRSTTASPIIGVVRDEAFQFYYPENIDALKRAGAKIVEINSLVDSQLPPLDALYIGGGFPETHAERLSENISFRSSLKKAIENGLPVYAECGGAMFLGESITWQDKTFPMTGAYPVSFGWSKAPRAHGYTILESAKLNPFFDMGVVLKGHEFHYSYVKEWREEELSFAFQVKRGHGLDGKQEGICYRNVLATYTHVHALGSPEWAPALVDVASSYRDVKIRSKKRELITDDNSSLGKHLGGID